MRVPGVPNQLPRRKSVDSVWIAVTCLCLLLGSPTVAQIPPAVGPPHRSIWTNEVVPQNTTPQIRRISFATDSADPILPATADPLKNQRRANPAGPIGPQLAQLEGHRSQQRRGQFAFNFKDAPWGFVLRNFAQQSGMSLNLRTEPTSATFTYFDENSYSIADAIDIFNDNLLPDGMILIRNDNKLTLVSVSQPLPDGLIPYASIDELPYLGRNTVATITIPVKRIDPGAAVAEVKELMSSLGRVHALQNSSRIVVTDTGAHLRRIVSLLTSAGVAGDTIKSNVYQLRNAPAEEVAIAINQFLLARDPLRASGANNKSLQIVVPEKTTNSLMIHGTREELADIQAIINRLDRTPSQVVIQALLVEVQLGNTEEFGVEVGLQDSVLFDRGLIDNIVSLTETIKDGGATTTRQNVISQRQTPGFNFNNQPLGNNTVSHPSRVGGQGLSNFGVGRVNGDLGFGGLVLSAGSESVNVLIRALSANFKTDILSRPQIRTLDNHEALIQIGQQVPIVDGVSVTAVGSANPIIRQDKAGIILKVIPRIGAKGRVMIDVHAEKSAFQLAPGTGVPIFTDVTNGNVIEAPVKDITTATTSVSVQTGQTIVLGGMITKDVSTVERKVPLLGDIPLLGRLFRFDLEQSSRKELLIFLTPHVIQSEPFDQEFNQLEMSRMCFPHEQAMQLHGDLSGPNMDGNPFLREESSPPGPQTIQSNDGERITVPPFGRPTAEHDLPPSQPWRSQSPATMQETFPVLELAVPQHSNVLPPTPQPQ